MQEALTVYRKTAEAIESQPQTILDAGGFGPDVASALKELGTGSRRLCGVDPFDSLAAGGASGPLTLTVNIPDTPSPNRSLSDAANEYEAQARLINDRTAAIEAQIADAGPDVSRLQPLYRELADVRHQAVMSLRAIEFPAEAKSQAEALIAALEHEETILDGLARSTASDLLDLKSQLTAAGQVTTEAARALRRILGIP